MADRYRTAVWAIDGLIREAEALAPDGGRLKLSSTVMLEDEGD